MPVGGQLHFQVDWLNTREDVQLNSRNKDFLKKPQATHVSYARSFLNCRQVCSEAPVNEQVSKSTIPVVGDRNSSANRKILKSVFRGCFPCLCVSAPSEVPSSCSQGSGAGTPELSPPSVLVMPGITPITKFSKGEFKARRF